MLKGFAEDNRNPNLAPMRATAGWLFSLSIHGVFAIVGMVVVQPSTGGLKAMPDMLPIDIESIETPPPPPISPKALKPDATPGKPGPGNPSPQEKRPSPNPPVKGEKQVPAPVATTQVPGGNPDGNIYNKPVKGTPGPGRPVFVKPGPGGGGGGGGEGGAPPPKPPPKPLNANGEKFRDMKTCTVHVDGTTYHMANRQWSPSLPNDKTLRDRILAACYPSN